MTKSISHQLRYDGATVDQVHAMLATPAFREKVCDNQRVLRRTVEVLTGTPAGGMTVDIDQVQAAKGIPGFAQKFVGSEIQITQHEEWSGTVGTVHMAIPGKPGEMNGTVALAADGGGVTETVRLDVKVALPLVGGKIEGLIADLVVKALTVEQRTGVAWLADHNSGQG